MIRGRYGLLTAVVVVAMLSVAAGAGFFMVYSGLPDPSVASREELLHWLVLRDLAEESDDIRLKIVSRADTEFEKVGDLHATIEALEPARRQMLWHNVTVLLEPWLAGKAEKYSQLPASGRIEFIDRFLDSVQQWSKVGAACFKANSGQREGEAAMNKLLIEQVRQCGNLAEPEQRRKIEAFVAAVQARWLWRQMPALNWFGRPKT